MPFAVGAASPYNSALVSVTAGVAQLVEQRIRNAKVTSSIPVIGTTTSREGGKIRERQQSPPAAGFLLFRGLTSPGD